MTGTNETAAQATADRTLQERFTEALPCMMRVFLGRWKLVRPDRKEELVAEATAFAWQAWRADVRNGKEPWRIARIIARTAASCADRGQRFAGPGKGKPPDVYAAAAKRPRAEPLPLLATESVLAVQLAEVVRCGREPDPAAAAVLAVDFASWERGLTHRQREALAGLLDGERPAQLAALLGVHPSRVSALRGILFRSWQAFQGE
jgi:hypothetical protein